MTEREPQASRTSSKQHSIWRGFSENEFRKNILALAKASGSVPQDTQIFNIQTWQQQRSQHRASRDRALSLEAERRLVDDLAFIAVPAKESKTVSAMTVEETANPLGLKTRLAANQGVANRTQNSLRHIFRVLAACARKSSLCPFPAVRKACSRSASYKSKAMSKATVGGCSKPL